MKLPEIIDLHMHTTASDGTDSPEQIIQKVREAKIELFAVTDHDGIAGAAEVDRLLSEDPDNELFFLRGIEFSCRDSFGKYHILGYDYDPKNEELINVVSLAHKNRIEKVRLRLDFIEEEFGFTFKEEDVARLFQYDNPGKPHIANMMIRYGYAASIEEAMKEYLNKKKFPSSYISPETAIQTVLGSGGVPILAHPFYGDGSQLIVGEEMEERLKRLVGFGLEGIEGYYSGFAPRMINNAVALSEKYDLYVTAGSDYHGTNKLVILGDTNLETVADGCENLRKFLRRVCPPEISLP